MNAAKGLEEQLPGTRSNGATVIATIFKFQSLFGLVAVFILATILDPETFPRPDNLLDVVRASAENGILAVGMTMVILIGGIDLSVGSVLGMASVGISVLLAQSGFGMWPAIICVLGVGLVFGILQGIANARFKIQAFIVTLAGMQVARGIARIWSGGQGVSITYQSQGGPVSDAFAFIGGKTFGGTVPIPAIVFIVIAVLAALFLRFTTFSRHVYAIGGNEKAARLSGVPVLWTKILVFGICGLLAALAGIVHAGQLNNGDPNDGQTYELDAIAAVVIGGASLTGGRGGVLGTVAGALLVGVLRNILALRGVNSDLQLIIIGLVIVLTAGLQLLRPASMRA
ncbi:ABC transporter permease [Sciscionella marina]|uniref:ABC transporter permease n=1 Tax=Sciscionella marina TaxID=508770 RepID=UPI000368E57C|nr:ABC transporter permease [Sciscionella marina]